MMGDRDACPGFVVYVGGIEDWFGSREERNFEWRVVGN